MKDKKQAFLEMHNRATTTETSGSETAQTTTTGSAKQANAKNNFLAMHQTVSQKLATAEKTRAFTEKREAARLQKLQQVMENRKKKARAQTTSGLLPDEAEALRAQREQYQSQLDLYKAKGDSKAVGVPKEAYAQRENQNTGTSPVAAAGQLKEAEALKEQQDPYQTKLEERIAAIDAQLNLYDRIDSFQASRVTPLTSQDGFATARKDFQAGNADRVAEVQKQIDDYTYDATDANQRKQAEADLQRLDSEKTDELGEYLSWYEGLSQEYQQGLLDGSINPNKNQEVVRSTPSSVSKHWERMTADEINAYYYLANTEGMAAAKEFLEELQTTLDWRHTTGREEATREQMAKVSTGANALRGAATAGVNAVAGVMASVSDTVNALQGKEFNPYSNAHYLQNIIGTTRSAAANDIQTSIAGDGESKFWNGVGELAANAYQAGLSTLDSMAGMYTMGSAYTVSMGMGAASSRMRELYESGATDQEIYIGAIGSGILEALFEKVSLESFTQNFIASNPEKWIKKALLQAGVEGSEEFFTEISNQILDAANRGRNSDHNQRVRELMNDPENPMSQEDAEQQAAAEDAMDIFWAAMGGVMSGGMSAAGGAVVDSNRQNQMGKDAISRNVQEDVIAEAQELRENDPLANQLQSKQEAGTLGKKHSDATQLGRLIEKNLADMTQKDMAAVQSAVEARLKEEGQKVRNGEATAEAIVKSLAGEELSVSDRFHLAINEKYVDQVKDEIYSVADGRTANNRWVQNIGTYTFAPGTFGEKKTYVQQAGVDAMRKTVQERFGAYSDLVMKMYRPDQNRMDFVAEVQQLYQAGLDGVPLEKAPKTKTLQDWQREAAWDMGQGKSDYTYDNNQGFATVGGEATPVNIVGVAAAGKGKLLLRTDDGGTVDAGEVTFGSYSESKIYSVISLMGVNASTANEIISMSQESKLDLNEFSRAMQDAFYAGRNGIPFEDIQGGRMAMKLTQEQRKLGWQAGRTAARAQAARKNQKIQQAKHRKAAGGVKFDSSVRSTESLNAQQQEGLKAAEVLAGLGLDITVYASTEQQRAKGMANGHIRLTDGSIRVDLNSGDNGEGVMAWALSHEFTHFVEELSPEKFQTFQELLFEELGQDGQDVAELIDEKAALLSMQQDFRELSEDRLMEIATSEVVAEMMEPMLTDTDAIARISNKMRQQDKGLWEKIKDWITGLVEKLKNAYKDLTPGSTIAQQTRDVVTQSEEILNAWVDVASDAIVNYNLQEGQKNNAPEGVQYSMRGINQDGIEVYETSDEVKALSWAKRKEKYLEVMGTEYRGRKARFTRNGHTYYAEFDQSSIRKPIYGDSRSSANGVKAIIKAGADGDAFDLVANSVYTGSKTNTKTHTNADYFDYFVKTVQIDGRVFDLIADVERKKKTKDGYVYSFALRENKKIKASPAHGTPNNGPVQGAGNAFTNSISSRSQNVNPENTRFSSRNQITQEQNREMEDHFGTTSNYDVAGYILTDGKMLDFSGRHWGDTSSDYRQVDHRDIWEVWEHDDRDGLQEMIFLISGGGIRLSPESGGINLAAMPNQQQLSTLRGYINHFRGDVAVDIDSAEGKTIQSFTYGRGVSSSKVISDLKAYFESGVVPENRESVRDFLYSSRNAQDSAYMAAVEKGDMETAQRMVDQAAQEAGYTKLFYHGSKKGGGFTMFRDWQYFTENKAYAKRYTERGKDKSLYTTYVKMEKPFDTRDADTQSLFDDARMEYGMGQLQENGLPDWTDGYDIADYIDEKDLDFDSILLDEGGDLDENGNPVSRGLSYVIRKSNQIKYADPVTYDDYGNVIPVSQRFDSSTDDIRYSQRTVRQLERENEKLRKDREYLKELVTIQRKGNKDLVPSRASVNKAAENLKKETGARGNTQELAELLDAFYRYIGKGGKDPMTMDSLAGKAVEWLQEHQPAQRDPYSQEVLDWLKKRHVSLSESQVDEIKYQYGSLREYQSAIKGSIIIDQKASTTLDQLWQEGAYQFADKFDADMNEGDMPGAFADLVESLKNQESFETAEASYYQEEIYEDLMDKVYDTTFEIKPVDSVSDTMQAKIDALKAKRKADLEKYQTLREETRLTKQETRLTLNAMQDLRKAALESFRKREAASDQEMRRLYEQQSRLIMDNYQKQLEAAQDGGKTAAKVEGWRKTEERGKLQRTLNKLNKMILNPTKSAYVPDSLQPAVIHAMEVVNDYRLAQKPDMETIRNLRNELDELMQVGAAGNQTRIRQINRQLSKLQGDYGSLQDTLTELKRMYGELIDANDGTVAQIYDEGVESLIADAVEVIKDTEYDGLNVEQLEALNDAYSAILYRIQTANKTFAYGQQEEISQLAIQTGRELKQLKDREKLSGETVGMLEKFGWNNLKPVYAFGRLGSQTMTTLYNNLRKGEDLFYNDIVDARAFALGSMDRHGYQNWQDKVIAFESVDGKKFSLNLEERMSLYAYSRRGQAIDHLMKGGIVLNENTKRTVKGFLGIQTEKVFHDYNNYRLSLETIQDIGASLTEQQRKFAEEMQQYLSTVCAEKNNEISRKLYGVSKAKEKHYWPLKVSNLFSERARYQQQNPGNRQKNAGHMKATILHANNPVEIAGFMETWGNHVNNTAMYHAFTLPMEDFLRVYNFNNTTGATEESTIQLITRKHGKGAVEYIDQLMKDLNQGVRADPRESIGNAMVSKFKKGAVSASLSVAIQQPSAIGRAFAVIDPKYFNPLDLRYYVTATAGEKLAPKSQELWEKMKRYAPVVGIKEMGRFDVNMGQSTVDFITGAGETGLMAKVDEYSGYLPEKMDQATWMWIWNAAERQCKAQGYTGEALNQATGELFTECITKTQVYDSVFSRSGNMRSKSLYMNMATSFMAEPTTTANMFMNAVADVKNGNWKSAGRKVGSIAVATILNAMLASFVYAARDDDEDSPYREKLLKSFTSELVDSFNIAGYVPVVKDVWSLLQGYDVERADMTLWSEAGTMMSRLKSTYENMNGLDEEDPEYEEKLTAAQKKVTEAWANAAGAVCNLFGVPAKNLLREVRAIINTWETVDEDRAADWTTARYAMWEAFQENLPAIIREEDSKSDELFKAMRSGSVVWVNRMKESYDSGEAFENAVKGCLRDHDVRIRQAAKMLSENEDPTEYTKVVKGMVSEGYFTQDQVEAAIQAEARAIRGEFTDYSAKTVEKFVDLYEDKLLNAQQFTDFWEYKSAENADGKKLHNKDEMIVYIGKMKVTSKAKDTLYKLMGYSEDALESMPWHTSGYSVWEARVDDPALEDCSDSTVEKYLEIRNDQITASVFADAYKYKTAKDEDGKSLHKQEEVMAYIDSLNLSRQNKDELLLAMGYKESALKKAPWN